MTVGKCIETLIGGIGFHSMDFENIDTEKEKAQYSFSDFAILFRTLAQGEIFKEILERAGIPCQIASKENMFTQKGVAEIISYLKMTDSAARLSILNGWYLSQNRESTKRQQRFSKTGVTKINLTCLRVWIMP